MLQHHKNINSVTFVGFSKLVKIDRRYMTYAIYMGLLGNDEFNLFVNAIL